MTCILRYSSSWKRQRSMIISNTFHGVTFLSIFFFPLSVVGASIDGEFAAGVQVIKSPGTFREAMETCDNLKDGTWHLPSPTPHQSEIVWHDSLIRNMETDNNTDIWLSLKRERLLGWKNIDNTTYDGRVQENGDTRKTCGLVKLRYEAAVSDFCESSGYGYVCQKKDCTVCPPDISPHNCLLMRDSCYILGCDAGSWFEASNRCVAMGTKLATLRSEDEVVTLVRKIKRRPNNPCQHFWVGILKAKWSFRDNIDNASPKLNFWNTNHPVPGHSCALLKKFDVGYYWASMDCQARHEFFCVKDNESGIMNDDQPNVKSTSDLRKNESEPMSSLAYPYPTMSSADVKYTINTSFHLQTVILVMLAIIMITAAWTNIYQKFLKQRLKDTPKRDHRTELTRGVQQNLIRSNSVTVV